VDVKTTCLIGKTMLYCVLTFYTSKYLLSSLFLVARRSCFDSNAPHQRLIVGHNNWYHNIQFVFNIWYQRKVNMKMSAIKFDIQYFDGVINFSRWQIRTNAILIQSGLKKALLGREKKPQYMKEKTWQKLNEKALTAIQFCLANEMLNGFSLEKHHPRCRSDLRITILRSRWRISWF